LSYTPVESLIRCRGSWPRRPSPRCGRLHGWRSAGLLPSRSG